MFSREEVWCFVTCTVALLLSVLRLRQDDEVALMLLVPMHCSHRVTLSVAGVPGDCLWSAGEHQGLASRADFSPHSRPHGEHLAFFQLFLKISFNMDKNITGTT